jgi:hypothetical protein
MWVSPAEYLRLDLRAHELLRDVPLYDVSVVDLPGGGDGRSLADIRAFESGAAPSRVASAIYGLRHFFGRVFGWDRLQMRPKTRCFLSCRSATGATRRLPPARLLAHSFCCTSSPARP